MKAKVLVPLLIAGSVLAVLFLYTSSVVPVDKGQEALTLSSEAVESLTAEAVFVGTTDGKVLYERNADEERSIASVTKLFTGYMVHRRDDLDEQFPLAWSDLNTEGESGQLRYGQRYSMHELIFPLLLSSSNDAGAAIERKLGDEYFMTTVKSLTDDLSLLHTSVTEPTGLSSANTSTARELAHFVSYLETADRHMLDITTLSSYVGTYGGWQNNNPGKQFAGFRGGKHGYTPEAGQTFAGVFESSGEEYVVVLLGSSDLGSDLATIVGALP